MKARSSKMNSPATRADAEDAEGWESVLLTLSIWVVLAASVGILLSSGFFVLLQMMEDSYELEHAAHVGEFWGGHLSALVLAFVALSLSRQAKQLSLQGKALRTQLAESTATMQALQDSAKREGFKISLDGIRAESEQIRGFLIEYSEHQEKPRRTRIDGVRKICHHLQESNETLSNRAKEVHITLFELDSYINGIKELQSQMEEAARTMDVSGFRNALRSYCPRELEEFHKERKEDRATLIDEIKQWPVDQQEQDRLGHLVDLGWSFELKKMGGQFVMTARRERADGPLVCDSEWLDSAAEAAKALVLRLPL